MSVDLQSFAFDTLFWTGVLIVAVLALRRPVSRHFGARAAYALWALPFLRLVLPPIVLPASVAPETAPSVVVPIGGYGVAETGGGGVLLQPMVASQPTIDWALVALTVWLIGALVFLTRRYALYFAMRHELMRGSVEVGVRGRVRLIESPATASPVAFGVFDKVIALPEGFMAQTESTRRDLALEHELAHHRARDLLANAIVQPLFALHWFNPLGWVGWRAMRRDQEAACDARVVERCDARLRETYASTIASFATRSDRRASLALAAPMACPVLGDKSIIHRLRSLTMSDISPRRRIAARVLTIGALAAMPLTASISYAETAMGAEVPDAPPSPAAPTAPVALEAPVAPEAPLAPVAPTAPEQVFTIKDEDGGKSRTIEVERKVVTDDAGQSTEHTSYKINGREATPKERAKLEVQVKKLSAKAEKSERAASKWRVKADRMRAKAEKEWQAEFAEEWADARIELREEMEDVRRELSETGELDKQTRLELAKAVDGIRDVRFDCGAGERPLQEWIDADSEKAIASCVNVALASAKGALAQARRSIERDRSLSERERAEALRSLDEAMREFSAAS
tara:strand:+ start:202 stop:1920 length:1719 start_codon:yes stop_codon:yes gene_type:complete